jgi:hypothetical protein
MSIYDSTIEAPETGYHIGLIDYLDPTHSVLVRRGGPVGAKRYIASLLDDYRPEQIVCIDSDGITYRIEVTHDITGIYPQIETMIKGIELVPND